MESADVQSYSVHEPTPPARDLAERADAFEMVSSGFGWGAAVFGPLWLLVHRLWRALAGYLIIGFGIELLAMATRIGGPMHAGLWLLLSVGLGLMAPGLLRTGLERRGYREVAIVSGRDREECEHRFLQSFFPAGEPSATDTTVRVT
jgi:hypothetical protein